MDTLDAVGTLLGEDARGAIAQGRLSDALAKMREALHRRGRLSSRNEALDELARLLFAHTVASQAGVPGIGRNLLSTGTPPAQALIEFVSGMVRRFLPESLEHDLGPEDFALQLRADENTLALELIDAFESFEISARAAQVGVSLPGDLLNDAFGQFIVSSFADEKELGQYLTPTEVVQFMIDLAIDDLTDEERQQLSNTDTFNDFGLVVDPSCGVGSFLAQFVRTAHRRLEAAAGNENWSAAATRNLVVGMDKSDRMIRLALANLATFGAASARLHCGNSLARQSSDGIFPRSLEGRAGLILTNPPFGATFPMSELTEYRLPTSWMTSAPATVDTELLFLERYIDWLRPGGQLLAVVPDSILTNKGQFAALRAGLAPEIELRTVISLPPVTFAAAGTSTKTSILHLRKGKRSHSSVRFAICSDIGYTVATRGSQRRKIHQSSGDLPLILANLRDGYGEAIRVVEDMDERGRWDATYNASAAAELIERAQALTPIVRVSDVATLSTAKTNPKRWAADVFAYIEIGDVDGERMVASAKPTLTVDAPSRARMVVHEGDVLVSTVRPERGNIGVVPASLDGAICTTGFAVLRPHSIQPTLLAALLRTEFVRQQMLRHNVGIAYPAIAADSLPEVVLPIHADEIARLSTLATRYQDAANMAELEKLTLSEAVTSAAENWPRQGE